MAHNITGEHAALLLNFIPTGEELEQLNKIKTQKEKCVFERAQDPI